MRAKPKAIFIMGPTASGKTAVAIELVKRLPVDIISVDSGQVYRGMDIGTAKPDAATLAVAPHRLIDIRDPAQAYSAAEFREDALREMRAISAAGRVPLLVGGTMLYFRALERGLSPLPAADPAVRAELEREAELRGWQSMHAELAWVDPEAAERIHPNDPQRIQRALEVYRISGRCMSEWQRRSREGERELPFELLKIAIAPGDRELLRARVAERFHTMMEMGLLSEVKQLYQRDDLDPGKPSVRSVGYRQLWTCLDGKTDQKTAVDQSITATRQLAKRQLTWLRGESGLERLDAADTGVVNEVLKLISMFPF